MSTIHARTQDSNIRQVTDNPPRHHHNLLGTATELRFKSFIQEYGKDYYTHEEYVHRLGVFAKNLIRAAEHQALDPTAVHGVTQFSDLSEEEFESMYLGVKGGFGRVGSGGGNEAKLLEVGKLPDNFDWREKGAVTEVKMQVIYIVPFNMVFSNFFRLAEKVIIYFEKAYLLDIRNLGSIIFIAF